MSLRQEERFGEMSLVVNTGEIQTGVIAIISPTGEYNPMRVHVPVMVAVGLRTIDLFQFTSLPCLQIE